MKVTFHQQKTSIIFRNLKNLSVDAEVLVGRRTTKILIIISSTSRLRLEYKIIPKVRVQEIHKQLSLSKLIISRIINNDYFIPVLTLSRNNIEKVMEEIIDEVKGVVRVKDLNNLLSNTSYPALTNESGIEVFGRLHILSHHRELKLPVKINIEISDDCVTITKLKLRKSYFSNDKNGTSLQNNFLHAICKIASECNFKPLFDSQCLFEDLNSLFNNINLKEHHIIENEIFEKIVNYLYEVTNSSPRCRPKLEFEEVDVPGIFWRGEIAGSLPAGASKLKRVEIEDINATTRRKLATLSLAFQIKWDTFIKYKIRRRTGTLVYGTARNGCKITYFRKETSSVMAGQTLVYFGDSGQSVQVSRLLFLISSYHIYQSYKDCGDGFKFSDGVQRFLDCIDTIPLVKDLNRAFLRLLVKPIKKLEPVI